MRLHQMFFRVGLFTTLAAGSTLASAAGEAASGGLSDNYIVLGLAAALFIFAFTRKSEKQAPPAAPASEPVEEPSAETEPPAEEASAEETGTTEGAETSEEASPESAG
jgi:cytoskeletal protein RodZ